MRSRPGGQSTDAGLHSCTSQYDAPRRGRIAPRGLQSGHAVRVSGAIRQTDATESVRIAAGT